MDHLLPELILRFHLLVVFLETKVCVDQEQQNQNIQATSQYTESTFKKEYVSLTTYILKGRKWQMPAKNAC